MEPKNIILGIIIILIILSGIGIYIYRRPAGNFRQNVVQGRNLFRQGSSDSITLFQKSLQAAKTPQEEASAKLNLGVAFLLSDPITAVRTLKQVAEDESYPPVLRSFAIAYIVDIYNGTLDRDFAARYIFAESEPWADFLKKASGDLSLASRFAYEKANELYPLPVTRHRVAFWYVTQLLGDLQKKFLTEVQRTVYLDQALQEAKLGDELLETELSLNRLTPLNQTNFNLIAAINYSGLYLLKKTPEYQEKAERGYKNALLAWQSALPQERARSNMGPRISLFYAGFIMLLPQEERNNRLEEIKSLVNSAVSGEQYEKTLRLLKTINKPSEDPFINLLKTNALGLAKIDERFANTLQKAGWDIR